MRVFAAALTLLAIAACASSAPYGPVLKSGGQGYSSLQIEDNRFRISYRDQDPAAARNRALRRAAETALEQGAEWFQVVSAYDEPDSTYDRGGSSVSIGAAGGSRGNTSVGLGIGLSLPLGGGGARGPLTHVLEIITGSGEKPEGAAVYDVETVLMDTSGA